MADRDIYDARSTEELAADFGMRIRHAREARGWTQADLGAKLNERASVIAKLESQTIVPTDSMIPTSAMIPAPPRPPTARSF